MRLDERWLWLGDTSAAADVGVDIYRMHPGEWWIAADAVMVGPFDDRTILRAVRVACTPTIDGCELGPAMLGVHDLEPRHALARKQAWQPMREDELPPSVTCYASDDLAPVSGCCSVDDAQPKVTWGAIEGWEPYLSQAPANAGRLVHGWNAHPAGSPVFAESLDFATGLTIVDLPERPC